MLFNIMTAIHEAILKNSSRSKKDIPDTHNLI